MDNKELLELAAKAADIKLIGWGGKGCWSGEEDAEGFQTAPPDLARWNPLTDDGDALRLAVKLGITASPGSTTSRFSVAIGDCGEILEERKPDSYAATRRAIVRAAAEIGRNMK